MSTLRLDSPASSSLEGGFWFQSSKLMPEFLEGREWRLRLLRELSLFEPDDLDLEIKYIFDIVIILKIYERKKCPFHQVKSLKTNLIHWRRKENIVEHQKTGQK